MAVKLVMVIGVLLAAVLLSAVGVEGAGWDTADCGAAGKPGMVRQSCVDLSRGNWGPGRGEDRK